MSMKPVAPVAAPSRVLVASDNVDDATQVLNQLKTEFVDIRASTDEERAADDFDECEPDVLILAFDNVQKAQDHMLRLSRATGEAPN